jgi:hypothetical protein
MNNALQRSAWLVRLARRQQSNGSMSSAGGLC